PNSARAISIVGSTDSSPKARAASSSPDTSSPTRRRAITVSSAGRRRRRPGTNSSGPREADDSSVSPLLVRISYSRRNTGGLIPPAPSKAGPTCEREDSNQLRALCAPRPGIGRPAWAAHSQLFVGGAGGGLLRARRGVARGVGRRHARLAPHAGVAVEQARAAVAGRRAVHVE